MKQTFLAIALALPCCSHFGISETRAQPVTEPVVSRVAIAMPPPRQEVISRAPAAHAVWIAGSWQRMSNRWEWLPGRWITPPRANACWIPGSWQPQRKGFVWIDAHWITAEHGLIVPLPPAIPLAFPETQVARPQSKVPLVWQPGHWEWRGSWVWEPGVYMESLYPSATWFPGEWIRMTDGHYRWTPAHWKTPKV